MDWTMAEGADYEEAVGALLKSLGADKSEVEIEDLGVHKKLFGLGGAVTRVRGRFRTDIPVDQPAAREQKREERQPRREPRENREPRQNREAREPRENREVREKREPRENRETPETPLDPAVAAEIAEKARLLLKEILDKMGVATATVTASVAEGGITLNIESDAGGLIIGRGGETLEALQTIIEIFASRQNEARAKIVVDTENWRARREEKLKEMAEKAANDAIERNRKVYLGTMKASERKLIHTILQDNPKVQTKSQGDGDHRQVVVYPVR